MNRVVAGVLAAAVTTGVAAALRSTDPAREARWRRSNYRGRQVDLTGGMATAAGATLGALATGGAAGAGAAVVTLTGGVLGALDDADIESTSKGLRGHLGALRRGEVTTGLVKLVGISAAAVAATGITTGMGARGATGHDLPTVPARAADALASGVLIAATANLVNLFDLRPGRALKLVGLLTTPVLAAPGAPGRLAGAALGAVVASWRDDLAEETMLGDAGANALGALAGTALAALPSARVRYVTTGVVVGAVVLSEKVSFSRVIAATPVLRELDAWGRSG